MRWALTLVGVVLVICAGIVAASPSPATLLSGALGPLALMLLVQAAGRGVSRFVVGYPSRRGGVHPPEYGRVAIVALLAGGLELLVVSSAAGYSRSLVELAYYVVLAGAGVALARWCGSSEQSPVFLATGVLVLLSIAAAVRFGQDPVARFEYGPERWLFAIWNSAARTLLMLPLDASVAWAAWHMATLKGHE